MSLDKRTMRLGAVSLATLALAWAGGAAAADLTLYPVRDNIVMFTSPSGNIVVATGKDGAMVIDPGAQATSAELIGEIRKLTDKPIRWVIDTNPRHEHVGANQTLAAAGVTLEGGNLRPSAAVGATGGAPIWANEGTLNRLTEEDFQGGLPTDSFFAATKDMFTNGESVQLMSTGGGGSGGDAFVYFRRTDVIVAGDVYTPDRYPLVDLDHGGSVQGVLDGLNMLIRYTVPEFNQEGGTMVIPGHGRISDEADVAEYRDMITIIRDRIKDMIGRRLTLAQIKAANPTFDYDPVFGGPAAGQAFTEVVYKSLTQPKKTATRSEP